MRRKVAKAATFAVSIFLGCMIVILGGFGREGLSQDEHQYTGQENHMVTLAQATMYIGNLSKADCTPSVKGGYFGRNIFEKILDQPGCVGIRYYYAAKDDGTPALVLVGVDGKGNDMEQGVLGEEVLPCPPFCSTQSPLYR